jgi:hypothetical protein
MLWCGAKQASVPAASGLESEFASRTVLRMRDDYSGYMPAFGLHAPNWKSVANRKVSRVMYTAY